MRATVGGADERNQLLTGMESTRKIEQSCLVGRTEYKTKQRCKESQKVVDLPWSRWLA
jgi:hypothetical protein